VSPHRRTAPPSAHVLTLIFPGAIINRAKLHCRPLVESKGKNGNILLLLTAQCTVAAINSFGFSDARETVSVLRLLASAGSIWTKFGSVYPAYVLSLTIATCSASRIPLDEFVRAI